MSKGNIKDIIDKKKEQIRSNKQKIVSLESENAKLNAEIKSLQEESSQILKGICTEIFAVFLDARCGSIIVGSAKCLIDKHGSAEILRLDSILVTTSNKGKMLKTIKDKVLELKKDLDTDTLLFADADSSRFHDIVNEFDHIFSIYGGAELRKTTITAITIKPKFQQREGVGFVANGYRFAIEDITLIGAFNNTNTDILTITEKTYERKNVTYLEKPVNSSMDEYISDIVAELRDIYGYKPVFVNLPGANSNESPHGIDFSFGNENNQIKRIYAFPLERYLKEI